MANNIIPLLEKEREWDGKESKEEEIEKGGSVL